jgi:aminopeptidase
MSNDPRLIRLANTLVTYSIEARPKQEIAIYGPPVAAPLIREVYRRLLVAGAYPYIFMGLEAYVGLDGLSEVFFQHASDDQIDHMFRTEEMVRGHFQGMIVIRGSSNTRALSRVDPDRRSRRTAAAGPLNQTFLQRSASGALRWVATLYPTAAYAQEAEMSLTALEDFVLSATFSDLDDPAARWREISARQQRLVDWLAGRSQVEIMGPGVDLRFSIAGRKFLNDDGHMNMPAGEVFTGPVEDSMEGTVRFSFPAVYVNRRVEGVELRFERGRVVAARADRDQAFLERMLETDPGARYVGEGAIGLNERIDRFMGEVLFDEKIGGTFHLALGSGYPETGSHNKSGLHWDMICDLRQGGEILVDGECILRHGHCLID